jgi:(1->4)-alpha-D-glucan 1-alpha-D-glucosylmutase
MTERIPGATYRLQFNCDFTFANAREIVSYLHEVGITDCYASPLFKAPPQSTHGYDVCDFGQLNPNLGSAADFEAFCSGLRDSGMGLILDIVPNHMSTDLSNGWWFDVLENGPASKYATWFDIEWQRFGDGKVVLPILEDELDKVLASGKLRLAIEGTKFFVAYYDRRFPCSPESQKKLSMQLDQHDPISVLRNVNGSPGQFSTFKPFLDFLDQQHYRLAYWRTTRTNYRRFFDVNELVSLRMELPEVFEAGHQLVSTLVQQGKVTGLRIDHPDGLWNPKQYLQRLRQKFGDIYVVVEKILSDDETIPHDWPANGTTGYDFLIRLNEIFVDPRNEEVFDRLYHHSCGHDFNFEEMVYEAKKRILQSSFPSELNALTERLDQMAGRNQSDEQYDTGKLREALIETLASFPVYRTYITEKTTALTSAERAQVEQAIHAVGARYSHHTHGAAAASGDENFRFINDLLLLRAPERLDDSSKRERREFVMKFQQLTGPLTAKALEDTTFYNFNRLISLNEVGGDPKSFGNSIAAFHEHNLRKAADWPHSLLATATHDTKRGEDVRARINVLSEIPDEWQCAIDRWKKLNAVHKSIVDGQPAPDANDEYLFYQTLIGAWPTLISSPAQMACFRKRLLQYTLKAIKESKTHTSWVQPNAEYETATMKFVEKALQDSSINSFIQDFQSFQTRVAFFGCLNSLSQVLLKMTAPGVPDFYQGTELWDFNLVDPDNRRPVDYELRQRLFRVLKAQFAEKPTPDLLADLLTDDKIGRSKLYLIWRMLNFRNSQRALFDRGAYQPLTAIGSKAEHVCSFVRVHGNDIAIIVAPRLFLGLTKSECRLPLGAAIWGDTHLLIPGNYAYREFRNVLTNEKVSATMAGSDGVLSLSQILAQFPIALLETCAETR